MKKIESKKIIIMGIAIIVVIVTIGVYYYKNIINKGENVDYNDLILYENDNESKEESVDEDIESDNIMVHVTGAVNNTGIVVLKEESRIIDAIEAAGGQTEIADLNKLNLAYILQDGDKLYVPTLNDNNDNQEETYITQDSGENVIIEGAGNMKEQKSDIVNINTANKDELITLNGIGESTADKIISYRKDNGKFKSIEEIKNVPGIGDAKFEGIKDKIKV